LGDGTAADGGGAAATGGDAAADCAGTVAEVGEATAEPGDVVAADDAAAPRTSPNDGPALVGDADGAADDSSVGLAEILPMTMADYVPHVTQPFTQSMGQFGASSPSP
jgi:hypothetical protein